jgi:hypothetical protein
MCQKIAFGANTTITLFEKDFIPAFCATMPSAGGHASRFRAHLGSDGEVISASNHFTVCSD